jgi:predicted phosphate transport protein (TIGR00153 family)
MVMIMARKQEYDYFHMFTRAAEYSAQAADLLKNVLNNFDPDDLKEKMKEMHAIEHAADIAKHDMNKELVRAFITPIEREDIMMLTQQLDDVTDAVEDVLLRLYMFNVLSIRDEALEFADTIYRCCEAMEEMMGEFRHFRKSGSISAAIVEINRLEEEGDALYTKAVRRLYMGSKDAVELMIWREIFDRMEKCCDACEHVANAVESIIMKNT